LASYAQDGKCLVRLVWRIYCTQAKRDLEILGLQKKQNHPGKYEDKCCKRDSTEN